MNIDDFLKSPIRNAWLELEEPASLYLRKANRVIAGEKVKTLDLATVEVQEEHQGKGVFKGLLKSLEKKVVSGDFDGLYVENILEPRLSSYLKSKGYALVGGDEIAPCLFKSKRALVMEAQPWAEFYEYFAKLENPPPEEIECCLSYEEPCVRGLATRKEVALSPLQIERLLNDKDLGVVLALVDRKDFIPNEEQMDVGLRSTVPTIRYAFASKSSKKLATEIEEKIINEGLWFERKALLMRSDFSPSSAQVNRILNNTSSEEEEVWLVLIERMGDSLTPEQCENPFQSKRPKVRLACAVKCSLPTVEQIERGLKDVDVLVQSVFSARLDEWQSKRDVANLKHTFVVGKEEKARRVL
jgi:hypothetical protein